MPFTWRGTHRIHYETYGSPDAPPLLLVMGMGLSANAWDTLPAKAAKTRYVITFDNRGTGESKLPERPYRIADLADDAAAVIDAVGLKETDVLGVSMGGMIAQELVLRHPEKVRRLALGCTFSSFLFGQKGSPLVLIDLIKILAGRAKEPRIAEVLVSRDWYAKEGSPAEFKRWRENGERGRARRAAFQLLAVGLHDTTSRLAKIRAPTLILTGDDDRLVDWRNSQRLARKIPNAKLVVFKGAGHVFPLEREADMIRELEQHFAWEKPAAKSA
jgi:3-oxoadipate enol-lactonase